MTLQPWHHQSCQSLFVDTIEINEKCRKLNHTVPSTRLSVTSLLKQHFYSVNFKNRSIQNEFESKRWRLANWLSIHSTTSQFSTKTLFSLFIISSIYTLYKIIGLWPFIVFRCVLFSHYSWCINTLHVPIVSCLAFCNKYPLTASWRRIHVNWTMTWLGNKLNWSVSLNMTKTHRRQAST